MHTCRHAHSCLLLAPTTWKFPVASRVLCCNACILVGIHTCGSSSHQAPRKEKQKKNCAGSKTLPASIKEYETHWPAVSLPNHLEISNCFTRFVLYWMQWRHSHGHIPITSCVLCCVECSDDVRMGVFQLLHAFNAVLNAVTTFAWAYPNYFTRLMLCWMQWRHSHGHIPITSCVLCCIECSDDIRMGISQVHHAFYVVLNAVTTSAWAYSNYITRFMLCYMQWRHLHGHIPTTSRVLCCVECSDDIRMGILNIMRGNGIKEGHRPVSVGVWVPWKKRKEKKNYAGSKTLPASTKEMET